MAARRVQIRARQGDIVGAEAAAFLRDGVETVAPGTVFGKPLEALDGSQQKIYVFVTLQ